MSHETFELEEIDDELLAAIQPHPYGKDDAETDFIFNVQLELAKALVHRMETHGLTRSKIAKALDLDKSTVSRLLAGDANLTARSIAALCFAMDAEPKFSIDFHDGMQSNGKPAIKDGQHVHMALPTTETTTGPKSNARQSSTPAVTTMRYIVEPGPSRITATTSKGVELCQ